MVKRCEWAEHDELLRKYHDDECGRDIHNDRKLFEFLILEGAQAGLSWLTVLKKRENYRKALDGFNPVKIAKYDDKKVEELLNNPGIIRNRLKIIAAIQNAKSFLTVQKEFKSFDKYIWAFVNNKPIRSKHKSLNDIAPKTNDSDLISKELSRRGFKFAGSTICYSFMQAVGMANDHVAECFRHNKK